MMKPLLTNRTLIPLAGLLAAVLAYLAMAGISLPIHPAGFAGRGHHAKPEQLVAQHHPAPQRPPSAQAPPEQSAEQSARNKLASLRAAVSPDSAHDPFVVHSWLPPEPPPPPPPVVKPEPPTAPPLPFTFVGTLDNQSGRPRVFLSQGDRLLIVSAGDVIDEQYRVESIAATNIELTYLPLNQKQVLSTESEGK